MKRNKRAQKREAVDQEKTKAAQRRKKNQAWVAKHEDGIKASFVKARRDSVADRFLKSSAYTEATNSNNGKYERLVRTVERKASRLLRGDHSSGYHRELQHICRYAWLRQPEDWVPKGKGVGTRYRSLCDHLFAKYPMPAFLWTVFENDDFPPRGKQKLAQCAIRIAQGDGLFKLIKEGVFPGPPMTRKVIHDFMSTPDSNKTSFMRALRRAQIRGHGGSLRMYEAWCRSDQGADLQQDEEFWDTVVRWVCRNPMLDLAELPHLVDYIIHRKREDDTFTMKGRSVLAMLRNVREWHHDLANARDVKNIDFGLSGIKSGTWYTKKPRTEGEGKHQWTFHEVLSSRELLAEGRAMKHCVYSYTSSIMQGSCSIWSLRCDGDRMLTIEVRSPANIIAQAKGKYNRSSTAQEMVVIKEWARKNNLDIKVYRW